MTSPFHNSQNTRQSYLSDPTYPRTTYASVAAANSQASPGTTQGSSRTAPTSFSHILNPYDGDWTSDYYAASASARGQLGTDDMTQNGSHLDGAAASGSALYQNRGQQLPQFSRAFEMFMSRNVLESLPGIDPITGGQRSSGSSSSYSFPRPSYLRDSPYLEKLEQQSQRKAEAQRESNGTQSRNGNSISIQAGKPPTSQIHLGMARDVVERTLAQEDEDTMDPLPTRWGAGKEDKAVGLEVLSDGLEVKYSAPRNSNERDHDACAIRADYPMPLQCGLYYFEVAILSRKHNDTTIGIGFSGKSVSLSRAPGWEPESWGYHGDDGNIFASQNVGKHYGPTFSTGDIIGCGVNFRTGTAFFTKNGRYLGVAFREVKTSGKLYPSVSLKKTGEHIRVNFGQTPFVFDIDSLMKKEIRRIELEILSADTSRLAPGLNETELCQQLVLQFLQHDGYVETARAFAREIQGEKQALCLDPHVEIPGIDIRDDEDAKNRQRIRRAILEGDIDKALKCTNAFYPQVLKENQHVYFRLRCRKFIEMIRREAEMNLVGGGDTKRSHIATGNNGHSNPPPGEDMELDEEMEDLGDAADLRQSVGDLADDALQYGQALQAEYDGDDSREVQAALREVFSLMAYTNPLKESKVAHLLDRKGRVAVAEELNSAILQSLGKSSRAALENLYAQTSVLLSDLAETGGPGAFVTLRSVVDEIGD